MKTRAPLWAWLALIVVLVASGRDAWGNVPVNEETPHRLFGILTFVIAPAAGDTGDVSQGGVAADSIKARIVDAWFARLRTDPAVAIAVPGGAAGLEAKLRDDATRERLFRRGVARLAPQDRLVYFMLLTKYIGQAAAGGCHGATSMQDIVDRISVDSMSDADAAEYFAVLYRIVIRSVLAAPLTLPASATFESALRHLDEAVDAELAGDAQAVARMEGITRGAPGATMADFCWASALLMHVVAAMSGPDRDALLLYMLDVDDAVPARPARTR
ncbi:hypothetical protein [Paraburkholderia unamae]|uniref:Uncharacterized protein n=1 Tax=Paraburkholderia unamae TaxID=219649 RepID=A0ABX5KII5_9BURK|nr:hypothetical protein [Paraburkholderia unamae]PVX76273.1 hypothetical protein C7402_11656 [Paraburkholderia unamae]